MDPLVTPTRALCSSSLLCIQYPRVKHSGRQPLLLGRSRGFLQVSGSSSRLLPPGVQARNSAGEARGGAARPSRRVSARRARSAPSAAARAAEPGAFRWRLLAASLGATPGVGNRPGHAAMLPLLMILAWLRLPSSGPPVGLLVGRLVFAGLPVAAETS